MKKMKREGRAERWRKTLERRMDEKLIRNEEKNTENSQREGEMETVQIK